MGSRFVRPDTARLTLANGDTLIVRRRLTHGEQQASFAQLYQTHENGTSTVNPLAIGMALVTAYLVDWHLAEDDVPIRGLSADDLASVLGTLSPEDFSEIRTAIETHVAAQDAARAQEKKQTTATPGVDPTSLSPSAATGAWTGSETLT